MGAVVHNTAPTQRLALRALSSACAAGKMGSVSDTPDDERLTFSIISMTVDLRMCDNSGDLSMAATRSVWEVVNMNVLS